jgi:hypothetical protein
LASCLRKLGNRRAFAFSAREVAFVADENVADKLHTLQQHKACEPIQDHVLSNSSAFLASCLPEHDARQAFAPLRESGVFHLHSFALFVFFVVR